VYKALYHIPIVYTVDDVIPFIPTSGYSDKLLVQLWRWLLPPPGGNKEH
jgi:hypothetical protein